MKVYKTLADGCTQPVPLALPSPLAQRVWCTVKPPKKIFRGQGGPLRLIWKSINYSVCTARWTQQTTLETFKLKEQAVDYINFSRRFSSSKTLNNTVPRLRKCPLIQEIETALATGAIFMEFYFKMGKNRNQKIKLGHQSY